MNVTAEEAPPATSVAVRVGGSVGLFLVIGSCLALALLFNLVASVFGLGVVGEVLEQRGVDDATLASAARLALGVLLVTAGALLTTKNGAFGLAATCFGFALMLFLRTKHPWLSAASALSLLGLGFVTLQLGSLKVAARAWRAGRARVDNSGYFAGCMTSAGLLLPPIVLVVWLSALATTAFVAVVAAIAAGPEGPRAMLEALALGEEQELAEKWALGSLTTDGAGEADDSRRCFQTLTRKRAWKGSESIPWMDAKRALQARGLQVDDAEDAVNQALVDVCDNPNSPQREDDLRAYFFRAAENKARDLFRAPRALPIDELPLSCPAVPIDELMDSRTYARIVAQERASLSAEDNLILDLYMNESSLGAIALQLGVGKSTVKRRFDAARIRLRGRLLARGCQLGPAFQVAESP